MGQVYGAENIKSVTARTKNEKINKGCLTIEVASKALFELDL